MRKIRLVILEPDFLLPDEKRKMHAFILVAKKRIQRTQHVQIEIVATLDDADVVYNPYTKESYYV